MRPLRCHLVYSKGIPPDQADDLVQSFITEKILGGDLLAIANRGRGKLRTLLRTALENHVKDEKRRERAKKRHPGKALLVSLPESDEVSAPSDGPAETFEVAWAREVLAEALRRTEAHYREAERGEIWLAFKLRVLNPTLYNEEPPSCADLASRLGFGSPQRVSNAVVTCSRALRQSIRSVLREDVADGSAVEEEIADLREILGRSGQYGSLFRV